MNGHVAIVIRRTGCGGKIRCWSSLLAKGHSRSERVLLGSGRGLRRHAFTFAACWVRPSGTHRFEGLRSVSTDNVFDRGWRCCCVEKRDGFRSDEMKDICASTLGRVNHHPHSVTASVKIEVFRERHFWLRRWRQGGPAAKCCQTVCRCGRRGRLTQCGATALGCEAVEVETTSSRLMQFAERNKRRSWSSWAIASGLISESLLAANRVMSLATTLIAV